MANETTQLDPKEQLAVNAYAWCEVANQRQKIALNIEKHAPQTKGFARRMTVAFSSTLGYLTPNQKLERGILHAAQQQLGDEQQFRALYNQYIPTQRDGKRAKAPDWWPKVGVLGNRRAITLKDWNTASDTELSKWMEQMARGIRNDKKFPRGKREAEAISGAIGVLGSSFYDIAGQDDLGAIGGAFVGALMFAPFNMGKKILGGLTKPNEMLKAMNEQAATVAPATLNESVTNASPKQLQEAMEPKRFPDRRTRWGQGQRGKSQQQQTNSP